MRPCNDIRHRAIIMQLRGLEPTTAPHGCVVLSVLCQLRVNSSFYRGFTSLPEDHPLRPE